MTASNAIVLLWLAAGAGALFYTARILRSALRDEQARLAERINGQVLYLTRARIHTARQAVAMAVCILGAALFAAADRRLEPPPFGIEVLVLLSLIPVLFVWKLRDTDRSNERLLVMLMRRERSDDA